MIVACNMGGIIGAPISRELQAKVPPLRSGSGSGSGQIKVKGTHCETRADADRAAWCLAGSDTPVLLSLQPHLCMGPGRDRHTCAAAATAAPVHRAWSSPAHLCYCRYSHTCAYLDAVQAHAAAGPATAATAAWRRQREAERLAQLAQRGVERGVGRRE